MNFCYNSTQLAEKKVTLQTSEEVKQLVGGNMIPKQEKEKSDELYSSGSYNS